MTDTPQIRPIHPDDAGEVLTIQRAAFASEARIYDDADMPPLTQTLEELRAELVDNLGCVALVGPRIVGAVRARADGDLLLIGRLAIAPDQQGGGLGTKLLAAVEARGRDEAGATTAELFTGGLSEANQHLYEREGYERSEVTDDGEIYYRKSLA
ncbi:GNAT family N-acetyltransferase [Microbacterium enclense]|uniref:GNAT family N-acetyltransferase n=1 Tax=Microbacterium enclense TaxID=993073 RepID=UPI0036D93F45